MLLTKKKKKSPAKMKKPRRRYYDDKDLESAEPNVGSQLLADDGDNDHVEIGEKPKENKPRQPLGELPSFITL